MIIHFELQAQTRGLIQIKPIKYN